MTVHLTLVAGTASEGQEKILLNTLGKDILDTAYTKSVAGEVWIKEFLDTMGDKDRKDAEQSKRKSWSLFKFGDGKESKSNHELTIPMFVGGEMIKIDVDVVDNDIPLLIGRPTMTKLGMVVDTKNHQVTINGKTQELEFNAAGYYVVSVSQWTNQSCNVVLNQQGLFGTTKQEKRNKAVKLHGQFAHASKEHLIWLLKDGGYGDQEFLVAVEKDVMSANSVRNTEVPNLNQLLVFPRQVNSMAVFPWT
eukprot:gene6695-7456_t